MDVKFVMDGRRNPWLTLLLAGALAIVALDAKILYGLPVPRALYAILAAMAALIAWAAWSFHTVRYSIAGGFLRVELPLASYAVPLSSITGVSTERKTAWWHGWGIRIYGRTLYVISDHGPAVKIAKKTGVFRQVVFNPENPAQFAAKLKETLRPDRS